MARNRLNSPYTADAGAEPLVMPGRAEEIEHFEILLGRLVLQRPAKSMIITGMRGVGKTVLLNHFEEMAQEMSPHWFTSKTEVSSSTHLAGTMFRMCRQLLLEMSRTKRIKGHVEQAFKVLKSFSLNIHGLEVSLGVDVDALVGRADSGDLAEDLKDLLIEVGKVAQHGGNGVVFFFDEVQKLSRSDYEALIIALHRIKQEKLPIAFVGAGLPQLPALTGEARTYGERLFRYPRIGALSSEDAMQALVAPAEMEGVSYELDAARRTVELTEGYPYFLQEYGEHVWAYSNEASITIDEVEAVLPDVLRYLDENFFAVHFGKSTKGQKLQYMAVLASLGDGPQESPLVAKGLHRATRQIGPVRDRLIKENLLYSPEAGRIDFTVPHAADYVRRHFPVEAVMRSER